MSTADRVTRGDAARVWVLATEHVSPQVAARWLSVLDDEERDRHARLVFEQDRHAYLGAHALLRCALSRETGVAPAAWRFVRRRGEKPVVAPDMPQLSFSVTHTRGLAACAVACGTDVGVDAETLAGGCHEAVAETTLSPVEREAVSATASHERARTFLIRWTLKEAYLKALGIGLHRLRSPRDLQRIAFAVDGSEVSPRIDGVGSEALERWRFATWTTATHVVSAGARGHTTAPASIVAASAAGALLPDPCALRCRQLSSIPTP